MQTLDDRLALIFRSLLLLALAVISYLSFAELPSIPGNQSDKLGHLAAFLLLALLADGAFPQSKPGWLKAALLIVYGLVIEIVQSALPYRDFSLLDWLADMAGVGCYGLLRLWLPHWLPLGRASVKRENA